MARIDDINAQIAAINDETNAIAAEINALKAQISPAGGLSAAEATSVLDSLTSISTRLQGLAVNPLPPATP